MLQLYLLSLCLVVVVVSLMGEDGVDVPVSCEVGVFVYGMLGSAWE